MGEFQAWFGSDDDCLDYLEWLRCPYGFVCGRCGQVGGWRLGDRRFKCAACGAKTSVAAGTIFDKTRTPLTVWFNASWMFASGKGGISALSVQHVGDRLVPDRVGGAAPAAVGAGAPGPGPAGQHGGGG